MILASRKAFEPEETGITFAAGETFRRRIVTTVGEREIDAELDSFADDVGFGKFDQRGVNLEASACDTGFGSDIGHVLERFYEFRSAIWVAAVVDCVYADKNVIGRNYFRPGKRICEKDGVARGNVCDWNSVRDFCLPNAASARRHRL